MTTSAPALENFKAAFHRDPKLIHLNNAGQSPICRPAYEALQFWSKNFFEKGAHGVWDYLGALENARKELALFLGADASETIYFLSAASAISQVALGLDLKPGDEVIAWDQEYPSNFYPWAVACERAGAKLIVAPSGPELSTPVETLEKLVTPRTRAIATSWVQYRSGATIDLKALSAFAKPRGIFVSVDVIQGVGCLPFNFHESGVDAACGGSHKWMTAPHGGGYLLLKPEHFERLKPVMIGAFTFGTPDDLPKIDRPMRKDVARFEPGGKAFLELIALGAAAKFLRETGIALIAEEAEWLTKRLMHGLRERGYIVHSPHGNQMRGAILNFMPGPDAPAKSLDEISERLKKIGVSFARREPGVRLSPHAHNSSEEIDRVLSALT